MSSVTRAREQAFSRRAASVLPQRRRSWEMSRDAGVPDASLSSAVANLQGLRLGRCARRILLLAPSPPDEPCIIGPERDGRAAAESHRRAMRRLAAIGLLELTWRTETVETTRKTQTGSVRWDPDAGVYREVEPNYVPSERVVAYRAARLTPLGALVVDRLRPALESGKRVRWGALS